MRCNQGSLQRIRALLMLRIGLVEKQLGVLKFVTKHREGIIPNPMMFMDVMPRKTYEFCHHLVENLDIAGKLKHGKKPKKGKAYGSWYI